MYNTVDLTHKTWDKSGSGVSSIGCYYKTTNIEKGKKYYYKLSNFDSYRGFFGHESINEVIVSRLMRVLGIKTLKYTLEKVRVNISGKVYETYACKSENFFDGEYRIVAGELYNTQRKENESPYETLRRLGFENLLDKMLVIDFLIMNRDRHDSNLEFIAKNNVVSPAPIFDNGLSFVVSITADLKDRKSRIKQFNPLSDVIVNNFIGSRSLKENLKLVKKPIVVNKLTRKDRAHIFYNLSSVIEKEYLDKIWEIICIRYSYLRKLGIIKERQR